MLKTLMKYKIQLTTMQQLLFVLYEYYSAVIHVTNDKTNNDNYLD